VTSASSWVLRSNAGRHWRRQKMLISADESSSLRSRKRAAKHSHAHRHKLVGQRFSSPADPLMQRMLPPQWMQPCCYECVTSSHPTGSRCREACVLFCCKSVFIFADPSTMLVALTSGACAKEADTCLELLGRPGICQWKIKLSFE
jgi:hypothetical protein